uniref:F-box domain-containing protein n=1 Tax=Pithovirus LCPAC401 TaxID=2506595 RepID=A0A481ZBC6_9VIRU|nr:MAG: uncharacterized protein LCPAC401_04030 [Pithovirus LCPAC401]
MNTISSDSLQTIFTYLDIGEISRKSLINHFFNKLCSSESLHKIKLSEDYSIVEKRNENWRSKAKEVYIESISFWKNVDNDIDYYMTKCLGTNDLIGKFEKKLSDHALRERKEFFVIKLIFRAPSYHYMYYMEITRYFCKFFITLFEKVASLSPQKKISIKWILNLINGDELEHEDEICTQDKCECECDVCDVLWKIEGLVHIYLKYGHLFIDDVDSDKWKEELIRQSI